MSFAYMKLTNGEFKITETANIKKFSAENHNTCKQYIITDTKERGIVVFLAETLSDLNLKIDFDRKKVPPSHLILSASDSSSSEVPVTKVNQNQAQDTAKLLAEKLKKLNQKKLFETCS
ncbi:hypothetical protein TKK_0013795 [Trichogramma kaykai]